MPGKESTLRSLLRCVGFTLVLAVSGLATVSEAGEFEETVVVKLGETKFIIEDVPVEESEEVIVAYIIEALEDKFDDLKVDFLATTEATLLEESVAGEQWGGSYRCHIVYDPNGNIWDCGGNPYDCLCTVVVARMPY